MTTSPPPACCRPRPPSSRSCAGEPARQAGAEDDLCCVVLAAVAAAKRAARRRAAQACRPAQSPARACSPLVRTSRPVDRLVSAYEFSVDVAARGLRATGAPGRLSRRKADWVGTLSVWPWSVLVPWFKQDMRQRVGAWMHGRLPACCLPGCLSAWAWRMQPRRSGVNRRPAPLPPPPPTPPSPLPAWRAAGAAEGGRTGRPEGVAGLQEPRQSDLLVERGPQRVGCAAAATSSQALGCPLPPCRPPGPAAVEEERRRQQQCQLAGSSPPRAAC